MKSSALTLVTLLGLYKVILADSNFGVHPQVAPVKDQAKVINCCKALKDAGLTHVLYEGDEEYKSRTASYWSVSAQLTPGCIVQPISTEEVSLALKTLSGNSSCDCQFAVRSGGHSTWAGSNNIENGLTIDLGRMNTTTYDTAKNVAKIQPGNRWGMVYGALEPHGVTVGGGRASSVGVAGFLTGGGNSFFTAHRGFACDQIQNFEVVLASGEIVNANTENNSDLFQVLKGGSGNFGIVTRFDMQAFEQGDLWGGTMVYTKDYTQEHIEAYTTWVNNVENYPDGSSIIFWSYLPVLEEIVILAAYEDVAGNVAPVGFDKFMAINATSSTMRVASHKALTDELEQAAGYRDVWFTMTFKNNPRIFEHIVNSHQMFVDEWKMENSDHDFITQCMFQAIPTIFAKHSVERGGNVLGLEREKDNAIMLLFNIAVKGVDTEVRARTKLRAHGEKLQAFAAGLKGLVEWQFMNYADSYQNPLGSYGAENVAKIRAASTKYDPTGIFQTRCPGGFKVSKIKDTVPLREEL